MGDEIFLSVWFCFWLRSGLQTLIINLLLLIVWVAVISSVISGVVHNYCSCCPHLMIQPLIVQQKEEENHTK